MNLSASQITSDALLKLKAAGARVRRVNNVGAYKKRTNQVKKGWPDIQGFSNSGLMVLCEVKTIGDSLKPEQRELLLDCESCGGIALIATEQRGETVLLKIADYLIK